MRPKDSQLSKEPARSLKLTPCGNLSSCSVPLGWGALGTTLQSWGGDSPRKMPTWHLALTTHHWQVYQSSSGQEPPLFCTLPLALHSWHSVNALRMAGSCIQPRGYLCGEPGTSQPPALCLSGYFLTSCPASLASWSILPALLPHHLHAHPPPTGAKQR